MSSEYQFALSFFHHGFTVSNTNIPMRELYVVVKANDAVIWMIGLYLNIIITSSNENIFQLLSLCDGKPPVTGGFPAQKDSDMDLWCYFVVSLNKLLNKHLIGR